MLLNLLALLAFVGAIVAVILLLVRTLPRLKDVSHPVCGGCGAPAEAIEAFICPSCHRDVRECGIHLPRSNRATTLLRNVGLIVLAVALLGAYVRQRITERQGWQRGIYQHGGIVFDKTQPVRRISIRHSGWQMPDRFSGTLLADAYLPNEDVVRLQIIGGRPLSFQIIDAAGKVIGRNSGYSRDVFDQWMAACGVEPSSSASDHYRLTAASEIDFVMRNARLDTMLKRSVGFTWSDRFAEKPQWTLPSVVIVASLIGLLLIAWQTRFFLKKAPQEQPA